MTELESEVSRGASTALDIIRERLPKPLTDLEASLGLPGGTVDPRGLTLDGTEATIEDWTRFGFTLCFLQRWTNWAIGDWMLWGEKVYGDAEASSVVDATPEDRMNIAQGVTNLDVSTLQKIVWVCDRVKIEQRRPELAFSYHEVVAGLDPEEQSFWLDQAVQNHWRREELRQEIKDSKRGPQTGEQEIEPPPGEPKLSIAERVEQAARVVFNSAQPTSEGGALVPPEAWHQLAAALGEE